MKFGSEVSGQRFSIGKQVARAVAIAFFLPGCTRNTLDAPLQRYFWVDRGDCSPPAACANRAVAYLSYPELRERGYALLERACAGGAP